MWKSPALFLLFLTLAAVLRAPFAFDPVINWDESSFVLMGNDLAKGHLPYVHAWDNKPPLLYVPYACAILLFGENVVGVRIVGIVLIALAALALHRAIARIRGPVAGLSGAIFLVVFACVVPGGFATMSEHVALPFLCFALGIAFTTNPTKRELLGMGLALGAAAMIRTNLAILAPFFFAVLISRNSRRTLAALGIAVAGFTIPVAVVGFIYFFAGEIDLLYRTLVLIPRAYASVSYALTPWESLQKMGVALRTFPQSIILYTSLAGCVLFALDWKNRDVGAKAFAGSFVLLAASIVATISTSRYFGHYFLQVLPFASVFAGRSLSVLWPYRLGKIALIVLLTLPLGPVVEKSVETLHAIRSGALFETPMDQIARYVRDSGGAGEYAYFPQSQAGYFLSGALIPTRLVHPPAVAKNEIVQTILGDGHDTLSEVRAILAKQPAYIVIKGEVDYLRRRPEAQLLIRTTLENEYRVEAEVEGIVIHKRHKQPS